MVAQADPSQYLCIAEQKSAGLQGLHYGNLVTHDNLVTHEKYILRRLNDDDHKNLSVLLKHNPNADWGFFKFGQTFPTALCKSGESGVVCFLGDMTFDKSSLRFSRAYYPDADADLPDDFPVEIGTCSPL
jgi:hypothetical protein